MVRVNVRVRVRIRIRVRVWVRVSVINLEYGWYIRGRCRQSQKLAKRYPVIVLA